MRRWVVPPAPLRGADELDGIGVLRECPNDLGVLLWLGLRDALLWADAPAREKGQLFAPGARDRRLELAVHAAADPALDAPLNELQRLLGNEPRIAPEVISRACSEIARWAEASSRWETALAFADAAARLLPRCGSAAVRAGAMARRFERHHEADAWLRRALGLSRRAQDWEAHARARIELGRLASRQGRGDAARRHFLKALRRARRHGLTDARAAAAGDLLLAALAAGDLEGVERYRRAAVRNLSRDDPRRPRLVLQLAGFWVEHGPRERAVALLRGMLGSGSAAELRFRAAVHLARAAVRSEDHMMMDEAWRHASALIAEQGETVETARALLGLARSAAEVMERKRAEFAGLRALDLAHRLGDEALVREATELLEARRGSRRGSA